MTQAAAVGTLQTGKVKVGGAGLGEVQQHRATVGVAINACLSRCKVDFVYVHKQVLYVLLGKIEKRSNKCTKNLQR